MSRAKPSSSRYLLLACLILVPSAVRSEADVFGAFTSYIGHQVQADKQTFVAAQTCTAWFYQQLQKNKPSKPTIEGVSFSVVHVPGRRANDALSCSTRYPEGLEAARKDFSQTQSSLSVSLTFYEFALVGDRNDDAQYSAVELRDMLESFGLPFNEALPPPAHLAVLNAQFDTIRRTAGLDALMSGMGYLYDRGYRFTTQDRNALNRLSG